MITSRKFPALTPAHPAIWEPCAICDRSFIAGDITVSAYGVSSPNALEVPFRHGAKTLVGFLCHLACAERWKPGRSQEASS